MGVLVAMVGTRSGTRSLFRNDPSRIRGLQASLNLLQDRGGRAYSARLEDTDQRRPYEVHK